MDLIVEKENEEYLIWIGEKGVDNFVVIGKGKSEIEAISDAADELGMLYSKACHKFNKLYKKKDQ